MKFVATKTADRLDLQAVHRVRERLVSQRTGRNQGRCGTSRDIESLPDSFRLGAREFDDLAPFIDFFRDELSKIGG
jgi:hypothetical protein